MRVLRNALLCALFALATITPAFALDRVVVWPGQNPLTTQTNQQKRFLRLGFGSWIRDALGASTAAGGIYSSLTVVPSSGLNVVVQPSLSNQLGTLYQLAQDDTTSLPPSTTPNLPSDSTLTVIQGTQSAVSPALGPLSAPSIAGQSIYYLIEGQVQTADTTPQSLVFYNADGTTTNQTVNTLRQDQIVYQVKAGTAASSPSAPNVDPGWIPIAYALIPYGTVSVTSGMITMAPAFSGFWTLPATGVATATTSYASQPLCFSQSVWNNVPQSHAWCEVTDNSYAFGNFFLNYDSTLEFRFSKTGTLGANKFVSIPNLGSTPEHISATCNAGDLCGAETSTTGALWLGGESSSCYMKFGADAAGAMSFGCPIYASSGGTNRGPVIPTYNMNGTTVPTTAHIVQDNITVSAAPYNLTLSGAAAYSNANSFACELIGTEGQTVAPGSNNSGSSVSFAAPYLTTPTIYHLFCSGS